MSKKITTEEFILRAKLIHGNKFDYSKSVYTKRKEPVIIRCIEHDFEFKQTPNDHLDGCNGCRRCRPGKGSSNGYSHEEFMAMIPPSNNDIYDYSMTKYAGMLSEITINCRKHGLFTQVARDHLHGNSGCRVCSGKGGMDKESFIARCVYVHKGKYDYEGLIFEGMNHKIEIICPIHGKFHQLASHHAKGRGCAKCAGRNPFKRTMLYILDADGMIKIGLSNNVTLRIQQLTKKSGLSLSLLCKFSFESYYKARKTEGIVHDSLKDFNAGLSGFDGATEFFRVDPCIPAEMIRNLGGKPE